VIRRLPLEERHEVRWGEGLNPLLAITVDISHHAGNDPGSHVRTLLTERFETRERDPLRDFPATELRLDLGHGTAERER
jgi:hypothetical protein